jgi:FkbM family methyltransferase
MKMNIFEILGFIFHHPLARRNKFKACLNFLRWQVGVRVLKKKVLIPWIDDAFLVVGKGDIGLTGNLYTGLLEFEDMSFLLHALRETEVFLDIGSNAGAYTVLASKVVGARTIAFEPIKTTHLKLLDQIKANGIQDLVTTCNMGVGAKRGELRFLNQSDTLNKVTFGSQVEGTEIITVTTLDENTNSSQSYFLKIDVEGFEYFVLEGAKRLLTSENVLAVIIELNDNCCDFGFTNDQIHNMLTGYGYFPVEYDPDIRVISLLNSFNKRNLNTIYVRDIAKIIERCKSSRRRLIKTPFNIEV